MWLIGFMERESKKFLVLPTQKRSAEVFIPLVLNHMKIRSTIYTDSFSVYVNNQRTLPESKL